MCGNDGTQLPNCNWDDRMVPKSKYELRIDDVIEHTIKYKKLERAMVVLLGHGAEDALKHDKSICGLCTWYESNPDMCLRPWAADFDYIKGRACTLKTCEEMNSCGQCKGFSLKTCFLEHPQ